MLEISYPKPDYHGLLDTEWSGYYGFIYRDVREKYIKTDKNNLVKLINKKGICDPDLRKYEHFILLEILMSLHRRHHNRGYYELIKSEARKKVLFKETNPKYSSPLLLNEIENLNHIGSGLGYSQNAIARVSGYCQQGISKKIDSYYHPNIKLSYPIEYMTDNEIKAFRVKNWLEPQNGKTTGQRLTDKQLRNLKQLSFQGLDIQEIQEHTGISQQTIKKYQKEWGL